MKQPTSTAAPRHEDSHPAWWNPWHWPAGIWVLVIGLLLLMLPFGIRTVMLAGVPAMAEPFDVAEFVKWDVPAEDDAFTEYRQAADQRSRVSPQGYYAGIDQDKLDAVLATIWSELWRTYQPGDDLRSVDWKATARRGWPVVREWQPERNQTLWVLLDCGRNLAARLEQDRTRLDRAVEAALALARAAAERGDRTGLILFGAEVERVVPPEAGRTRLGPLAEALHLARSRPVEADFGAAFDALMARQRRRALVVVFTDLGDPEATALLLARAAILRRRHLVALASIADPELAAAASARPASVADAFARAAAERILAEREGSERRLTAAGVTVIHAAGVDLPAAVVMRYAAVKERGLL